MQRPGKEIAHELRRIDLFTALDSRQLRIVFESTRVIRLDDGERAVRPRAADPAVLPPAYGPAQALSQLAERRREDHRDRPAEGDVRAGGDVHGAERRLSGQCRGARAERAARIRQRGDARRAARVGGHLLPGVREHEPPAPPAGGRDREAHPASCGLAPRRVPGRSGVVRSHPSPRNPPHRAEERHRLASRHSTRDVLAGRRAVDEGRPDSRAGTGHRADRCRGAACAEE